MITPTQLKITLTALCTNYNMEYNVDELPVKVGPDCYMFYATQLNYECRKLGMCKETKYYALTGGKKTVILDNKQNRVE